MRAKSKRLPSAAQLIRAPVRTVAGWGTLPSMTTTLASAPTFEETHRLKWTRDTFHRAWEMGLFGEGRVELVYGEVIEIMSMSPPHALVLRLLRGALLQIYGIGPSYIVDSQMPFLAANESQPEPDLAVYVGSPFNYEGTHPGEALLLVEVSDATLTYDLGTKARLYAQSGVPEYWVADLSAGLLHVHRSPLASPAFEGGYRYQSITRLTRADSVPLPGTAASLLVGDVLPAL